MWKRSITLTWRAAQPTTTTGLDSHHRPQTQELQEWLLYNKLKRVVPGTDGRTCATTTCWRCQRLGHFSNHCPTAGTLDNAPGNSGDGHTQLRACLHAQSLGIKSQWLLLDTGSTMRGISNASLVSHVKLCSQDDSIWVHSNSGFMDFTQQGCLKLFDFPVF